MIAIIGGSIAAFYAYKTIKELDKTIDVKVFSKEDRQPYAKMVLPYLISGNRDAFFEIEEDDILMNCEVKAIDTKAKTITTPMGLYSYERLIIAAGADAYIPQYEGDYDGFLFGVRYLKDIEAMREKLRRAGLRHIVILGAGLVSLEMAHAFVKLGFSVSVIASSNRILSQILPKEASVVVQRQIESLYPVKFYTSNDVEVIYKTNDGVNIRLKNGEHLDADFVVVGKGVKPNIEFLDGAIQTNSGIVVDDYLRATDDVFAVGDIAESTDAVWGDKRLHAIWPVAIAQAKVAAKNAAGLNIETQPEVSRNILPIFDMDIFSGGDSVALDGDAVVSNDDGFRMVVVKDGILRGFCMVGRPINYGGLVRLVRDRTRIDRYDISDLLFGNV